MPCSTPTTNSRSARRNRDLCADLVTTLRSSKGQPKNLEEDDDLIALCQEVVTCVANGNGDKADDSGSNNNDNDSNVTWYNRWVDKPLGECGHQTTEERPGWGNAEILEVTNITDEQYRRYMKSAHRLCGYYFNITKTFRDNMKTRSSEYAIIVETMKKLHPCFQFHTDDWLTRHMILGHCHSMHRAFKELGEDPDVAIDQRMKQKQEQFQRKPNSRIKRPLSLPPVRPSAKVQKTCKARATNEGEDVRGDLADLQDEEAMVETSPKRKRRQVVIPEAEPVVHRPRVTADPDTKSDMDVDADADLDTNALVPLKNVDKGKGKAKAVDLNEEPSPKKPVPILEE